MVWLIPFVMLAFLHGEEGHLSLIVSPIIERLKRNNANFFPLKVYRTYRRRYSRTIKPDSWTTVPCLTVHGSASRGVPRPRST